ncbi:uncharacterized protein C8Q71DRAFT_713391, partial [Rhodofomes roseus]
MLATCRNCRQRRRTRYDAHRLANQPAQALNDDDIDPIDDRLAAADGVDVVEPDEYAQFFGDDSDFMDIDVPEENALPAQEAELLTKFYTKLSELSLETCVVCHEQGFDMKLKDGVCSRCHRDRAEPVKKFAPANNVSPSLERPACLKYLTDMEEMLISRVLPMMQVRYTRG